MLRYENTKLDNGLYYDNIYSFIVQFGVSSEHFPVVWIDNRSNGRTMADIYANNENA